MLVWNVSIWVRWPCRWKNLLWLSFLLDSCREHISDDFKLSLKYWINYEYLYCLNKPENHVILVGRIIYYLIISIRARLCRPLIFGTQRTFCPKINLLFFDYYFVCLFVNMNCTFFDLMCIIYASTLPWEDILDVTYDFLQNNKTDMSPTSSMP